MRFKINKAALFNAAKRAASVAPARVNPPVRVEAFCGDGAVRVSVWSHVSTLINNGDVDVEIHGGAELDARTLAAALRGGGRKASVVVELDGSALALVTDGGARVTLPASPLDVSTPEPFTPSESWWINAVNLDAIRDGIIPAVGQDSTRPQLMGVHLEAGAAVATDGYRIHVVESPWNNGAPALPVTVPVDLFTLLPAKCNGALFQRDGDRVRATAGGVVATVTALADQYPHWRQVMMDGQPAAALFDVDAAAIAGACARHAKVSGKRGAAMHVALEVPAIGENMDAAGALALATTTDNASAADRVPVKVACPPICTPVQWGVNARFLADAIAATADGGVVTVRWFDPLSPVEVKRGTRTALVMPMRI